MKKDIYIVWGHGENLKKLIKSLFMLEHTILADVATFTGVPERIIAEAAVDYGFDHFITDDRPRINADEFYDSLVPEVEVGETREERMIRIREAISSYQNNCPHEKMHCRCARCMKILGSEQHYLRREQVEDLIKRTFDEQVTLDFMYNDTIEDFCRSLMLNLDATR